MRAALLQQPGSPLVIEDVSKPKAKGEAVVVKVAGCGACHSDLHVIRGHMPMPLNLPLILGHEIAGYVDEVGELVEGVKAGDKVAVYGGWGCGHCRFCRGGEEQLCDVLKWVGIGTNGGYAEYVLVPTYRYLLPLDELDPVKAAPLTDAALTPYRAVKKTIPYLYGGSYALIIGIGGLGQFGLSFLKLLTPAQIIAVDTVPQKLELAKSLGADYVVDGKGDVVGEVKRITGGEGAQAVVDFVGINSTLGTAAASVAKAGIIVLVGLGGGQLNFSFFSPATEAIATISQWGSFNELEEVIALAKQGKITIRVEPRPIEEINDVFDQLERGEISGRAVIVP